MNDLTALPELARRINDEHDRFEATIRAGLQHARTAASSTSHCQFMIQLLPLYG